MALFNRLLLKQTKVTDSTSKNSARGKKESKGSTPLAKKANGSVEPKLFKVGTNHPNEIKFNKTLNIQPDPQPVTYHLVPPIRESVDHKRLKSFNSDGPLNIPEP